MPMRTRVPSLACLLFVIAAATAIVWHDPGTASTSAQPSTFLETFTGDPAVPQPWHPANWDVQKHSRDYPTWQQPTAVQAQHAPDCGPPPAAHAVTSWDDAVFLCRDHLMTALNAGYAVIYLTPPALADFSQGPAVIQWEMSTERMSTRDWVDLLVTPWNDNIARPLLSDLSQGVDLQGPPRNTIHLGLDNGQNAPVLKVARNGAIQTYNDGATTPPLGQGVAAGTNQSATRQLFRLTLERTRVRFERLASATAPALTFVDVAIADVGWTRGVVQFGHHSYDPTKEGAGVPGTWHWDNVSIAPAVPFTIIPSGVHYLESETQTVTFPQAAPANAMLRFAAQSGEQVQVSFDGGPFQVAQRANQPITHQETAASYWTPIPQGTTRVRFRATGSWWGGFHAIADPHIWVQQEVQPSPSPTSSPSPGPSPIPTPTPTPVSSPSPTPSPTPSPSPTASPSPAPSPTPTPSTYRCQRRQGNQWVVVWTRAYGGACP